MTKYLFNKKGLEEKIRAVKQKVKGKNFIQLFSGGLDSACVTAALKSLGAEKILYLFVNRKQGNYEEEKKAGMEVERIYSEIYPDSMLGLKEITVNIPAPEIRAEYKGKVSIGTLYAGRNIIMGIYCWNAAKNYSKINSIDFSFLATGSNTSDTFGDNNPDAWLNLGKVFTAIDGKENMLCLVPALELGLTKKELLAFALDRAPKAINAINASYSCWAPEGPCWKESCKPCKERHDAINYTKELLGNKAKGLETPPILQ